MAESCHHYEESGIAFYFPRSWNVIKYDTHRYFQAMSGAGMRGADFIWLDASGVLTIMEVKHFRSFPASPPSQTVTSPEHLTRAVAIKLEKTLAGLRIVNRYLSGKQSFRLSRWLSRTTGISGFWWRQEWAIWSECFAACHQDGGLRFCLWYEEDRQSPEPELTIHLQQLLEKEVSERISGIEVECLVASRSSIPDAIKGIRADWL